MPALTIGGVLAALADEFDGITSSKVRFWESQGLIQPRRTASGYRQYFAADVERIRLICRLQQTRHLPLDAIRSYLDDLDRGLEVELPSNQPPRVPQFSLETEHPAGRAMLAAKRLRLSRNELCQAAQISARFLTELGEFSLVDSSKEQYDEDDVVIAGTARVLAGHGIEPRHLKRFKTVAETDAGLIEGAVGSLLARKTAAAQAEAGSRSSEIAAACAQLHGVLLNARLDRLLRS
ncbi:MerR family transcriptional regulator [Saxibacter everestensis]|uniref:MerR family transcriptional regulator n=1 Tax=Saxibacter everestensis TaxID=2909229 RepID=A0ABY8QWU4_9MICO|nr:MerR family transcriptional regulator [Brevibacteriaceae bacterium ZFBP1038]